ncbi:helix-turn-helix transcriptional regulator [Paenarthrobacter nicotinovorans]|uniref:helix-turn-helix transcriptional regulator n=1 Tax=Paenarthrobacter nicotinovorans TaxID=29320 RepID=UPI0009ECC86B|nr:helix-turn-helix transcriptional regulator [Paenarthrobacter nicotinovorans]
MSGRVPTAPGLGAAIREARKQRGWSQSALGDRAGVSRPTVARVEAGDDISTATLFKVATALGMTLIVDFGRGSGAPN